MNFNNIVKHSLNSNSIYLHDYSRFRFRYYLYPVKKFQRNNKLVIDGIVGKSTWKCLLF
ncbi:peptidoglycan-binding domain-containing protein [Clostridium sp.]|uniref:peptidoglycan-binding domain-containing protein n=1 Tax=Clostridium sp. TaxID=1506 RepID=UPI003F4B7450